MIIGSAEDYFRRARQAEDNGDLDEAAMFESLYRQSLPTMLPPAEHIPKMPPPQPHTTVTSAKVRGAEETGPARLAQGGLADAGAPRHQGRASAA